MRLLAFLLAVTAPLLLNDAELPDIRLTNQLLAIAGWGCICFWFPGIRLGRAALLAVAPLATVLGLLVLACGASWATGLLDFSTAAPTLGYLVVGIVVLLHGCAWGVRDVARALRPFAAALCVAALASAVVGGVQLFAPTLPDTLWYAATAFPGRVAGNIGQPNQIADVFLWGFLALLALWPRAGTSAPAWRAVAILLGVILLTALGATESRTGFLNIVLLGLWGLLDRGLPPAARRALVASPLVCLVTWIGLHAAESALGLAVVSPARGDAGVTAFRVDIWRDTLRLIAANPWTGVGWGGFGFAWTLSPIGSRPAGFVDNAHDLPLQLAVELGLPLALVVIGLASLGVVAATRRLARATTAASMAGRLCLAMAGVGLVHALLEYPFWFAYLLLPVLWASGLAIGASVAGHEGAAVVAASPRQMRETRRQWCLAGFFMVCASASAGLDYRQVVVYYRPADGDLWRQLLDDAKGAGILFHYHTDAIIAVTSSDPELAQRAARRAGVARMSGRLLYAWANALEKSGDHDRARYLAQRLREFPSPANDKWFAPCADPAQAATQFQCQMPSRPLTWRDFR